LANIGVYWALLEARSRGEVGMLLTTSNIYKLKVLGAIEGGSEQVHAEDFPSQIHIYEGKPLRRAPLRAISGSSVHQILVPSVLLGYRDMVEQEKISL
jgi:hypothetical protein